MTLNLTRLKAMTDSRGKMLWSCSYDAAGRRTQTTGLYGLTTVYDYEDVSQGDNRGLYLDGLTHTLDTETIYFEYERDLSGNITSESSEISYLYDKNYSLKSVVFEDESELIFTYDNLFNRVTVEYELDTVNYTLDDNGLNQYASIDSETLEYDDNGNLTRKGSRHFLYDAENQLLATYNLAGEPNEIQVSLYSYDEFGRRISKAVATGVESTTGVLTESYLYDGFQAIGEYDESGEYIRRRFIYAAGIDEPIAMIAEPAHQGFFGFDEFSGFAVSWLYDSNDIGFNADADLDFDGIIDLDDLKLFAADYYLDERPLLENPKYYGYVFDGLGSVVALSYCNDPNQTGDPNELPYFVETYEYDAFGDVSIYDPNNTLLTQTAIGNPYLFTGRRFDSESGLYYYRFRMYDSELGRFLQTDPMGYYDSMNLYQYCLNNPTNWVDPWGLARIIVYIERGTPWGKTSVRKAIDGEHGHAWIRIETDSGNVVVKGAYRQGLVDDTHRLSNADIKKGYDIDESNAQNALNYINNYGNDNYNSVFENCTDFVYHVAGKAGINLPGSDWGIDWPDKLADNLKQEIE